MYFRKMHLLKTYAAVVVLFALEIHAEEAYKNNSRGKDELSKSKGQKHRQMRNLFGLLSARHFNRGGYNKYSPDKAKPDHLESRSGRKYSLDDSMSTEQNLGSSFGYPEVTISANGKPIFSQALQHPVEAGATYKQQKRRMARSVTSNKNKGPIVSSFRRINRDSETATLDIPNESAATATNQSTNEDIAVPEENVVSVSNNPPVMITSSIPKNPGLPSISEAITTPNNGGGTTKVEVNLSFGCFFFCE